MERPLADSHGSGPTSIGRRPRLVRLGWLIAAVVLLGVLAPVSMPATLTRPGGGPAADAGRAGSGAEARPRSPSVDPDRLAAAFERAAELPALSSLIVWQGGAIAAEEYFGRMRADRQVNIKSASKTILSALVGIALDEGYLESLDQRLPELLPDDFPADASAAHREITLRHLLTMTSGLRTTSFRNYGRWVANHDWVRAAIDRPMVDRPGGRMIYSTGSSHLVSAILTRATGMSTAAFARRYLFGPLGIASPAWDRDPRGFYVGGNNMALTPRDLVRIGELYVSGGSVAGRHVLTESWIEESWRPYRRSSWNGYGYGYFWWYRRSGSYDVHFAWGYGGQYLFVVPELQLVVVATSSLARGGRRHRAEIHQLLDRFIVPAVSADLPPAASPRAGA